MPLPTASNHEWPPKALAGYYRDTTEADAWWSGDPERLKAVYANVTTQPAATRRFWSKRTENSTANEFRIHVPLAADIAQTGADLLFSDDAAWTIPEAHGERPDANAANAEQRLAGLAETANIGATLLEAAELAGGLGGVYLRPSWEPTLADHPLLDVIGPDRAVPEFRRNQLAAVTFWKILPVDSPKVVYRHLERHEPGWIYHGLYAGDADHLGVRIANDRHPETAPLPEEINLGVQLRGWRGLLVGYVPNVRPHRKHRHMPVGRPDTAGSEALMDALDRTITSWMRDIDLGKARIIVANEFLERRGRGQGATFDSDREIFAPLEIDPANTKDGGITPVEFKIRTTEHAETAMALTEQVIRAAGYSPQSFGMKGDGSETTATEVRAREAASLRTTGRKQRYWRPALEGVGLAMLAIDRAIFGGPAEAMRPRIDFGDPVGVDLKSLAETVQMIAGAQATSIETRVRMFQPGLEDAEVQAEVERIKAEEAIVADPTGGFV